MRSRRTLQTLVIAAGYGFGAAALYAGLPEQIPPLWSVSGRDTIWLGGAMVAFLLPTAAAVTDALLRSLYVRHPLDEGKLDNAMAIYDAIMLRFVVFVIGVHAMVLVAVLGLLRGRPWADQVVPVMLGLTMISIGNLLPRTRPNLAIGIRTSRTLSDRALWIRTHRSAGYLVVALGAVVVLSAIAVPAPIGPGMIHLVGPAALIGACFLMRSCGKRAHF
jgi:uncharacterized membrane protein